MPEEEAVCLLSDPTQDQDPRYLDLYTGHLQMRKAGIPFQTQYFQPHNGHVARALQITTKCL